MAGRLQSIQGEWNINHMEDKQYTPPQAVQTITSNINLAFDCTIGTRLTKRQASSDVLSFAETMSVFCTTPWSLLTSQPRTRSLKLETSVPSQFRLPHAFCCQYIRHKLHSESLHLEAESLVSNSGPVMTCDFQQVLQDLCSLPISQVKQE